MRPEEEAEAEGMAFVAASRYGLDIGGYSFGYIAAPAGDANLLRQAGERTINTS